ncbi:restriction endonuclease subunit S [Bifidobacterium longum]|nr:restriction endonuclease subunit S [Bifidobacterium longum]MDB6828493.1 restriction endonuclease subunit S [Bifidobacterium longum]
MMTEQAKVPAIRFAGFTDPWEQRKLENLASFGGGHTPSMADASNYVDGKILWVTSQDVKQHYIENTTTMISEKGAATLTLYPSDSIVIVARSGILRHTIPVAKLRKPATVNQDIKVIQTVDSCDSSWLLQYFIASNKTLLREYGKTGTTVESIDFAKMKSTALMVPYIEEQQAIGSFFSRLDNLITLHQRKYDKLVIFKKSMLEKMFPKDGESVPEIRFAGFTDPWEQRKASEVFQIVDDRGHPTLPVLSATQNQGMIYRDDSGRYIGHDESNEIGYKRVLPGDFVVHLRSFQGGFAHSQYEGITSPAYTVFRAKEPTSHSDRFWKHWFMSEHFIAGLSTVTYGIRDGRSISVDEFMNTFLAFPAVEEQAAISRLFDYLDDLITLHQRKLELLQDIKKSLLDKMFV